MSNGFTASIHQSFMASGRASGRNCSHAPEISTLHGMRTSDPQWCNQDFFQDQDTDQDLLWCLLDADRKVFFIFGRKRNCRRKWNSIYGRKWNENENWHSFSAEMRQRKSPDNISVFFFFFIHSVTKSALQCAANTSSSFAFFAGGPCWVLTGFHFPHVQCIISLWHFSKWHFNPWTVCFPCYQWKQFSTIYALYFTGVCVA